MLKKLKQFVSYTIRYLSQLHQLIKLVVHARVEPLVDFLAITTSKEYRKSLTEYLLNQYNGTKEVDHAKRNNLLDSEEYSYICPLGYFYFFSRLGSSEEVLYVDGIRKVEAGNGNYLITFFEYDKQDYNGGI